jgi:hypothetical protein
LRIFKYKIDFIIKIYENMSENCIKVFTLDRTLGIILEHMEFNLNGHKCLAMTKSRKRCTRKNCVTKLLCKQHEKMWHSKMCFSIFYHPLKLEVRCNNWRYFRDYNRAIEE